MENPDNEGVTLGNPVISVDRLVASSIKNPEVLIQVSDNLKSAKKIDNLLLPSDSPLVAYTRDRLEREIAQFGIVSQVIQEAVTNGAEARRSTGERVTVQIRRGEDLLEITDNGKGMRLAEEFFAQVLRPHSGEEGKIRGQFGQGTKSYWGLLQRDDSFIEIHSTTERGESFSALLRYQDGRRVCEIKQIAKHAFAESGTSIKFIGCELGNIDQALEAVNRRVEYIDYAEIVTEGEVINARAMEGRKAVGENGQAQILNQIQTLRSQFGPTTIAGTEFYARL